MVGAVLLAACSSGGGGSTATTTTTNGHGTTTTAANGSTTTTVATGSTTTTGGGTTTSTAAASRRASRRSCGSPPSRGQGRPGRSTMTVSLTNVSSTTCTLQGYPGMQLLAASGSSLPTQVVRGGTQFPAAAANQSPALVTLGPATGGDVQPRLRGRPGRQRDDLPDVGQGRDHAAERLRARRRRHWRSARATAGRSTSRRSTPAAEHPAAPGRREHQAARRGGRGLDRGCRRRGSRAGRP